MHTSVGEGAGEVRASSRVDHRRSLAHRVALALTLLGLTMVTMVGAAPHERFAGTMPPVVDRIIELGLRALFEPWMYFFFAAIILLELHRPIDPRQSTFGPGFRNDLIAWYGVNVALSTAVLAGVAFGLDRLHELLLGSADLGLIDRAGAAGIVVALVMADGLRWWTHWLRHRYRVLWAFHAIHHSQREMNAFTDVRSHLGDVAVSSTLLAAPLLLLGATVRDLIVVELLQRLYQRFYHANIRTNLGPLGAVLVTPQSHRIHHSTDPVHQRHNLGNILTIWDRLFGTWWSDRTEYAAQTGMGSSYVSEGTAWRDIPRNYVALTVEPFRTLRRGRSIRAG